jgi:uncharacterized damage-inducible protein DinB
VSGTSQAHPRPGVPDAIGYALWHLEEARQWTLGYLEGLSEQALEHVPRGHPHSIATLLYHIAVFEVDWVYTDLLGNDYDMERRIPGCPEPIATLLPYEMLTEDMEYTPVRGEPLETHLERLRVIRGDLIEVISAMDVSEFRRVRPTEDGGVTAEWVLMHLARHESEHRGQIWVARTAAEKELTEGA